MDTSFVPRIVVEANNYRKPRIVDYREIIEEVQILLMKEGYQVAFNAVEIYNRLTQKFSFREDMRKEEILDTIRMCLKRLEKQQFLKRNEENKYVIKRQREESLIEM